MAIAKVVYKENASAAPEVWMDTTQKTVTAGTMLSGTTALKNDGTGITGNIASKSSSDLTASGATVTAPAGYYPNAASKAVASGSASTPATSITANPTISVNASGLITASVSGSKSVTPTVSAGYVTSGTAGTISVTGSNTEQLSTQAGTTITPTESEQTAVASGKYTTGAVKVGAISSTYVGSGITQRDSTDLTASGATITAPAGYYAEAASTSVASGSAGTPTATKGTVSNHSISVTPSVTNATGYITGSTINGTAVTVDVTELESGTKTITENGTGISVSGYSSVDVAVPGQVPTGVKYSWGPWDGGPIDVSGYEYCVIDGMPVKDGHYRAWVDLSDITSSVTANVTIRFNRTQGTVKINWGDGSSVETLSSSAFTAYKEHSYSIAGKYVLDVEFVSGQVGIYGINNAIVPNIVYIEDACLNNTTASNAPQNSTKLKTLFQDASCIKVGSVLGCTNLELVVLSPNLTEIPVNFVRDCTSIKNITIPSAVTNIQGASFSGCSSLSEIHFLPTEPPTLYGSDWFYGINSSCVFYVPSTSLTDYQSATNWSAYASRMVGE